MSKTTNTTNKKFTRSTTYRAEYFRHNPPDILNFWFCAYCGRPLSKKKVTIDHIISVKAAQTSRCARKKLTHHGKNGVNDWHNLVASCRRCNSKKGTKQGIWLWRAWIGKQYWFRLLRFGINSSLIISVLYFLGKFTIK